MTANEDVTAVLEARALSDALIEAVTRTATAFQRPHIIDHLRAAIEQAAQAVCATGEGHSVGSELDAAIARYFAAVPAPA